MESSVENSNSGKTSVEKSGETSMEWTVGQAIEKHIHKEVLKKTRGRPRKNTNSFQIKKELKETTKKIYELRVRKPKKTVFSSPMIFDANFYDSIKKINFKTHTTRLHKAQNSPDEIKYSDMFYDVEKILDNRQINNKMEYLVRWEGYDQSHDQWIEESMFSNFNPIHHDSNFHYF